MRRWIHIPAPRGGFRNISLPPIYGGRAKSLHFEDLCMQRAHSRRSDSVSCSSLLFAHLRCRRNLTRAVRFDGGRSRLDFPHAMRFGEVQVESTGCDPARIDGVRFAPRKSESLISASMSTSANRRSALGLEIIGAMVPISCFDARTTCARGL